MKVINTQFDRALYIIPVLFFAAGLAGLQQGRRSPRVVRVANVDFYGHRGAVFVVYFSSQSVDVYK